MVEGERRHTGTRSPAVLAWMRLVRVHGQLSRAIDAEVRRSGLSGAQFDVLAQVGASEGRSQQALADALLVTKGNVTQILDRMEACGLLERRQVGRTKCISLTERGRALWACVVPAVETVIEAGMRGLSPEEQRQLGGLLRTVDRTPEGSEPGA